MLPAFLITFREVIEASFIVATILGILTRIGQKESIMTVWSATLMAVFASVILLGLGSLMGIRVQEAYTGRTEQMVEGALMITSALFITWAVFFLHNYFVSYKVRLLQKVKSTIASQKQKGLFILVFTAVFREGFEIALFLSTIYFSANPQAIFSGFALGSLGGLLLSAAVFTATLRLPVYYAFRTTSILLIFFAAGLLARGIHEFAEVGFVPETAKYTFAFLPHSASFAGSTLKAVFGITQTMHTDQILLYVGYSVIMYWWVFLRKVTPKKISTGQ